MKCTSKNYKPYYNRLQAETAYALSKKINFLLAGCGRIGQRHAQIMSSLGQLQSVCDIDLDKAMFVANQYHCAYFTSFDTMLASSKADSLVAICTPNYLHAPQSIAALQHKLHVLCEKPMALSGKDCAAMIHAADAANKKLFVVKQNRYNPAVAAVKEILDDNRLGKIYSIQLSCFWNRNNHYYKNTWKGKKVLDGGTLYTQFSHFIDLLYWMFGDVKHLQAIIKNSAHQGVIEFEDNGAVTLEFNNGIIGSINYTVNAYQKNMEGSLTIFGEKGTVKIGGQYLNELEYQAIENYTIPILPSGNAANNYGDYEGSMSNHEQVYEHVINTLKKANTGVVTNSFEALKTVEIIERIYQAAAV